MLEEYIKELETDLKIDELNLKDYQLRLPGIKHKWAGRIVRHKLEMIQFSKKCDELKKSLTEKIQQESPVKLSLPTIAAAIENHTDYKNLQKELQEKKLVIELIEKAEKIFQSATYDIKNLIEIIKLETT